MLTLTLLVHNFITKYYIYLYYYIFIVLLVLGFFENSLLDNKY